MNDGIHDLIALAARLEHYRSLPPRPLFRRETHARDGPATTRSPLRRKESRHGPPGASQHGKRPIDYHSKGTG
jgi:hypothetical protein